MAAHVTRALALTLAMLGVAAAQPLATRAAGPCHQPQAIYFNGGSAAVRLWLTLDNRCRHAIRVAAAPRGSATAGEVALVPVGATTVLDLVVAPLQSVTLLPGGETSFGSVEWTLVLIK